MKGIATPSPEDSKEGLYSLSMIFKLSADMEQYSLSQLSGSLSMLDEQPAKSIIIIVNTDNV